MSILLLKVEELCLDIELPILLKQQWILIMAQKVVYIDILDQVYMN